MRNGLRSTQRLPPGARIPDFAATTLTGQQVTLASLTGARSLVGFFAAGCRPCHEQLPEFAEHARRFAGAEHVLAVVAGPGDDASMGTFASTLAGIAAVASEPLQGGSAQKAFSVPGFPSYYVLDEQGLVESSAPAAALLAEALQALLA